MLTLQSGVSGLSDFCSSLILNGPAQLCVCGEGGDGEEVAVSCAYSLFNSILVSAGFYYITYIFILYFDVLSCLLLFYSVTYIRERLESDFTELLKL